MSFIEFFLSVIGKSAETSFSRLAEKWVDKVLESLPKVDRGQRKIKNNLRDYAERLSRDVTEVRSLAFPNQPLSIFKVNVPMFVYDYVADEQQFYSAEDIAENISSHLVIIDQAGRGKSTFSKWLACSFFEKTSYNPIFIELRKVDGGGLEQYILSLFNTKKNLSKNQLEVIISRGVFVFILDGFDEVRSDFQPALMAEIESLSFRLSESVIILTTRPIQCVPNIPGSKTFIFSDFKLEDAKLLIENYDSVSGLDIAVDLSSKLNEIPYELRCTPLLISLIYRAYSYNKTVSVSESGFYEDVFEALYKGHDLRNKNWKERVLHSSLDIMRFRRVLTVICFRVLVKQKLFFDSEADAINFIFQSIERSGFECDATNYFLDLLEVVSIIVKDGNQYKFIHKTLIEYFAAEYILQDKETRLLSKKLYDGKLYGPFIKVFQFLNGRDPALINELFLERYAKIVLSCQNFKSHRSQVMQMLSILCDAYIALVGDDVRDSFPKPGPVTFNRFVHTMNDCIVDGKRYWFAMTYTSVDQRMQVEAFRRLTIEKKHVYQKIDDDLSGIEKVLGFNAWKKLDDGVIAKLDEFNYSLGCAYNVLANLDIFVPSPQGLIVERINLRQRVLSVDNAQKVINSLASEQKAKQELEGVLLD